MNKQALLQYVDQKFQKKEHTDFNVGDTIRVHAKITEGNTTRVQVFEGVVLGFQGVGGGRTFTVRKISFAVGVERAFPLNSPAIEKITVVRSGHVRRAKLYYLRDRLGKAARLTEKEAENNAATSSNPAAAGARVSVPTKTPAELVAAKEK